MVEVIKNTPFSTRCRGKIHDLRFVISNIAEDIIYLKLTDFKESLSEHFQKCGREGNLLPLFGLLCVVNFQNTFHTLHVYSIFHFTFIICQIFFVIIEKMDFVAQCYLSSKNIQKSRTFCLNVQIWGN